MNGKYTHRYTIAAADIDPQYRLTPHAVLLYFQDCFARYMTVHRLAAFDIIKEQKMWVITEYDADLPEVDTFWSEEIDVVLWISEVTSLRIYCDYIIRKATSDTVIATGSSCWNLLNTQTKRLETATFLSERIAVVPEMMTATHKKQRFPEATEFVTSTEHCVTRLDLDFNGHVNNRCYLSIALLTTPDDFLTTRALRHICIHWLRETYLGDTISCECRSLADYPDECVHTLRRADGSEVAKIHSLWQPVGTTPDVAEVIARE